jgi:succinate-semialdehyde dehydrogenase/glutarate-semialdehyde dehydrogenase
MSTMQLSNPLLFRQFNAVAGQWVTAASGKTLPVTNPGDGSAVGTVPSLAREEVVQAVQAAHGAFLTWSKTTPKERSILLRRWAELIRANLTDLALIMTTEQGKPLAEARGEITQSAEFIEWFAEEGRRVYGDVIPSPMGDRRLLTIKQAVGVCAAITPWNFPSAMLARKVGPALAVGCTMLIKPATQTPFSAIALVALAEEAGIPKGVLSLVTGSSAMIGEVFCSHPLVKKLTFTGSTEVGRVLLRQCADTVKKVSMELGGNAPFIVFDDADVDAAVDGLMISKYRNAGQTCVCANRVFVQAGIHDLFVAKLLDKVAALKMGIGTAEGVTQGPMIDEQAVAKVEALIADANAQGAKVLAGGKRHALGGSFFEPTVVVGIQRGMLLANEEIFGPVAALVRFETEKEVIALANDTDFGLAGYFYARDLARVWRVAEALECGMLGINTGFMTTVEAPFGGVKQSGMGREGSKYGVDDYVTIKYLAMAGL